MAGRILPGWAVAAGRYGLRRWARASRWAVVHTDSRRAPSPASDGCGTAAARGGRRSAMAGDFGAAGAAVVALDRPVPVGGVSVLLAGGGLGGVGVGGRSDRGVGRGGVVEVQPNRATSAL